MTHDQHMAVIDSVQAAAELRRQADRLERNAKKICDHRREDGSQAVICPFMCDSPHCEFCGLDECYVT